MNIKKVSSSLLLTVLLSPLFGQEIPIGEWRSHFAYNNTFGIADSGDKIYAAAAQGIYILDKEDNSLQLLSKVNGLSGIELSAIAFEENSRQLFIGYANGAIDLLDEKDNSILTFDQLKTSDFSGNKRIEHFDFHQNTAYISTGFGLLLFDLQKKEIMETIRNLGGNENGIVVHESVVFNDSIFLASAIGMLAAPIEGVNLQDFTRWKEFGLFDGIPRAELRTLTPFQEKLYTALENEAIYSYQDGKWQAESLLTGKSFQHLDSSGSRLWISTQDSLWAIEESMEPRPVDYSDGNKKPQQVIVDAQGKTWIADGVNGLYGYQNGRGTSYLPSGPVSNTIATLRYADNTLYALTGGFDQVRRPLGNTSGFSLFRNGFWSKFSAQKATGVTLIPPFNDAVDIVVGKDGTRYIASFGFGLLTFEEGNRSFIIIDENSPGSPLINIDPPNRGTFLSALSSDQNGIWMANYAASTPLHLRRPDGSWTSFALSAISGRYILQIIPDLFGLQWLRIDPVQGGGILVFDPESGQERLLNRDNNNGDLPSNAVNDIVVDRDGLLWVATDNGAAFFAENVPLSGTDPVNAFQPIFEARLLFDDEKVNHILVDGGNRKWMSTESGLWLFNDSVDELLAKFDESNSPLPSNTITDMVIQEKTGELFFATDKGMVSFRGTATTGGFIHEDVQIFPNPVSREFNGTLGISGLASDAEVKITDISGKLIRQLKSQGGTATWNIRDYNGNRAATGMYLVFSATSDGSDTFVGKLAVVN